MAADKADQICGDVAAQVSAEMPAATFDPSTLIMMILSALIDRLSVCPQSPASIQARLRTRSFWVRDAMHQAARDARASYGLGTDGQPLDPQQVQAVTELTVTRAADADPDEWAEMLGEVRTNRVRHRLR